MKRTYKVGIDDGNPEVVFMAISDCISSYGGRLLGVKNVAGIDVMEFEVKRRKFKRFINMIRKETPRQIIKVHDVYLLN